MLVLGRKRLAPLRAGVVGPPPTLLEVRPRTGPETAQAYHLPRPELLDASPEPGVPHSKEPSLTGPTHQPGPQPIPQPVPKQPPHPPTRLAVLISGGGRTLLNLQDHIDAGTLPARIELVIASRDCPGVARALDRGLDAFVIPGEIPAPQLAQILTSRGIELVVLAGYLRRVAVPPGFEGRIINIHPALLPDFGGPGMHGDRVHQAVLDARRAETGCTVHVCTEEYDRGPILLQRRCPVLPGDDVHTLAARVFELEQEAYPAALRTLIAGLRTPKPAGN